MAASSIKRPVTKDPAQLLGRAGQLSVGGGDAGKRPMNPKGVVKAPQVGGGAPKQPPVRAPQMPPVMPTPPIFAGGQQPGQPGRLPMPPMATEPFHLPDQPAGGPPNTRFPLNPGAMPPVNAGPAQQPIGGGDMMPPPGGPPPGGLQSFDAAPGMQAFQPGANGAPTSLPPGMQLPPNLQAAVQNGMDPQVAFDRAMQNRAQFRQNVMAQAGQQMPGAPPGPNMAGGGLNPGAGGATGSVPGGQPGPGRGPGFGSNMGGAPGGGYPGGGNDQMYRLPPGGSYQLAGAGGPQGGFMPPPQGIRNLSQVFQTMPGQQPVGMQPNLGGGANGAGGGTMQRPGMAGGGGMGPRNPMGSWQQ